MSGAAYGFGPACNVQASGFSAHQAHQALSSPHCRLVAVLERVQGGLIGQTLSRLGVAGLYTVVVLSISKIYFFLSWVL